MVLRENIQLHVDPEFVPGIADSITDTLTSMAACRFLEVLGIAPNVEGIVTSVDLAEYFLGVIEAWKTLEHVHSDILPVLEELEKKLERMLDSKRSEEFTELEQIILGWVLTGVQDFYTRRVIPLTDDDPEQNKQTSVLNDLNLSAEKLGIVYTDDLSRNLRRLLALSPELRQFAKFRTSDDITEDTIAWLNQQIEHAKASALVQGLLSLADREVSTYLMQSIGGVADVELISSPTETVESENTVEEENISNSADIMNGLGDPREFLAYQPNTAFGLSLSLLLRNPDIYALLPKAIQASWNVEVK